MPTTTMYSEAYQQRLFQIWYEKGCPSAREFSQYIQTDDNCTDEKGRKVSLALLQDWMAEGWWIRRDKLDAIVSTQIDDALVAAKVHMLEEQAAQFRLIRQKAADFLMNNDFDSSSSAVSAFIKASQEERIARGLSRTIQELAQIDNDGLLNEIKKLAGKVTGDIIDMEEEPDGSEEDISPE